MSGWRGHGIELCLLPGNCDKRGTNDLAVVLCTDWFKVYSTVQAVCIYIGEFSCYDIQGNSLVLFYLSSVSLKIKKGMNY
jgi:hypothetical protein